MKNYTTEEYINKEGYNLNYVIKKLKCNCGKAILSDKQIQDIAKKIVCELVKEGVLHADKT